MLRSRILPLIALACALARPASAQIYETVGIRAQGMAGAFVAIADDSTATWWNPAGLASGAYFSSVIEHRSGKGASDEDTLGVSLMVPSLGLSYYRVRTGAVLPPFSAPSAPRQFSLSQFGVTTGQSIGEHLVVASTAKLVRADQTRGDLDLGAIVKAGPIRLGISARNMIAPDLTVEGFAVEHKRQVRAGAAFAPAARGGVSLIADVDADLTTTATASGVVRHVAAGAELRTGRVGLRGGGSVNSIGGLRQSFSAGASFAVRQGTFIDAHTTRGDDESTKSWGFALRVTF